MEIETLKTKSRFPNDKQSFGHLDGSSDLTDMIDNLKSSHSWKRGELISMILLNNPEKQILLTALHGKTEVKSFQSKVSITFQIIEGKVTFNTLDESVILNTSQLLTLSEKVNYSLTAIEDTVFLLTISNRSAKISTNN
jgi:hypothetical protein